ncbi:MAG: hypothetical protein ABIQ90_11150 [Polaromonas sp.]
MTTNNQKRRKIENIRTLAKLMRNVRLLFTISALALPGSSSRAQCNTVWRKPVFRALTFGGGMM